MMLKAIDKEMFGEKILPHWSLAQTEADSFDFWCYQTMRNFLDLR